MRSRKKSVGLLGGTFDPVHKGHVAITRSFLKANILEELIILLTPDPPHKRENEFCSYEHRREMLNLAFEEFENVTVSDLETQLSYPSYTIQTIEHLKKIYPESEPYLCIGEDSLADFKSWHRWKSIVEQCTLMVAVRPDVDTSGLEKKILENVIFVDHNPLDLSSTIVRERLSNGMDIESLVPTKVATYIKTHKLYGAGKNNEVE